MSHQKNLTRIKAVYNALGSLRNDVVFVGGATVSLYADRMVGEIRPTEDVDVLVEVWAHKEYAAIEEQLRKKGFINDKESRVACRYIIHGITVDIMATGKDVIGFSNKWYPDGYVHSSRFTIDENHIIRIFTSPFFIATKLEAFKSSARKDNNNGINSTDFEDIVFVLENRSSIWQEFNEAPMEVKKYLLKEFRQLLKNPLFEEWIGAHAGFGSPPATYYIIDELKKFAN
jgi:hypothetical protein